MSREDKDKVRIKIIPTRAEMRVQILAFVIWTEVIDPDKISIIFFSEFLILTNPSVITNLPSLGRVLIAVMKFLCAGRR